MNIAVLISETQAFKQIISQKRFAGYAGADIVERQARLAATKPVVGASIYFFRSPTYDVGEANYWPTCKTLCLGIKFSKPK